jgi:hypothetical protein
VKSGDVLTVIGAIAIVVVVALIANPQYLAGVLPHTSPSPSPVTVSPTTPGPAVTVVTPTVNPGETLPAPTIAPPYRIFYSDKPLSYPVYKLPDNMATFGASDIPIRTNEMVTFAFIEDTRGGVSQVFTVPYAIWVLNTTVVSNISPQYGNFRMVLCYASNGTIIEGQEILNRGSAYHVVQVSNTPVYMIIGTAYIDRYRINLQTPLSYYDSVRQR